jgi:hypothetical protein
MTPEKALEVLEEAASKYLGTRKDHELLVEAIGVLKQMIAAEGEGKATGPKAVAQ